MNFSEYAKVAFEELQPKQELLIQKIGYEYLNFEPDDLAGKIKFYHKETKVMHAEFGVVLVGSYHLHSNTWQWAWGNKSLSQDQVITLIRQVSSIKDSKRVSNTITKF